MMSDAATIASACGGKPYNEGWIIRCPVVHHGSGRGDRRPSCTIKDGDVAGRFLVHCFAGCDPGAILDALRASGLITTEHAPAPTHPHLKPRQAALDVKSAPEPEPNPEALRIWLRAR